MAACGERQAAGCGEVGRIVRQFGDDAFERRAFQRLLHCEQRIDGAPRPHQQKPPRRQSEQVEAEAIGHPGFKPGKVGLDEQRLPAGVLSGTLAGQCRERQRKARGRTEMDRSGRRDFMQGAQGQPAAKERVGPAQAERQDSIIMLIMLGILHALTKARERCRGLRTGERPRHGVFHGPDPCSLFVLIDSGYWVSLQGQNGRRHDDRSC